MKLFNKKQYGLAAGTLLLALMTSAGWAAHQVHSIGGVTGPTSPSPPKPAISARPKAIASTSGAMATAAEPLSCPSTPAPP